MRIVHIHDTVVPNMGYQENHLPAKQRELGHNVHIITSDRYPPRFKKQESDKFQPGIDRINGVPTHRLESYVHFESIGRVVLKELESKLEEINPDVIQCRGVINSQTVRASRYCENNNIKLFVDSHIDNGNLDLESPIKKAAFLVFKFSLLGHIQKNTDKFLPVQREAKKFLEDSLDIQNEDIEMLPLGVDKDLFAPTDKPTDEVRDRIGVGCENEFLIIFSGNINPSKDLDVLIRAILNIAPDYQIKLLIQGRPAGDNGEKYLNKLKQKVNSSDYSETIVFGDFIPREDLPDYFNAADLGVWPGKLGITAAEAIGTGLPIIICDSEATNYLIKNNNGMKFERDNNKNLEEKIITYITNQDMLKRHAEKARSHAEESLSWDRIAKKNINIYESS